MTINRTAYLQASERAAYYRWMAVRGNEMAGGDPLTGAPKSRWSPVWRDASRVAHIALARHFLAEARRVRLRVF